VLSLAGWALTRNGNGKQEFISVEARRGDIEDLVAATGSLQPRDYVDVGAQVSGQLRKIYVEVGQSVKEAISSPRSTPSSRRRKSKPARRSCVR
jgi:macrolide-specific efflux system membrane fusion protein